MRRKMTSPKTSPRDAHDEALKEERPPVHAHELDRPDVGHAEAGLAAPAWGAGAAVAGAGVCARSEAGASQRRQQHRQQAERQSAAPQGGGRTNSASHSSRDLLEREDALQDRP